MTADAQTNVLRSSILSGGRGLSRLKGGRSRPVQVLAVVAVSLAVGIPIASSYNLWPFVVIGISSGAIYSLAAIGLVLIYKTSGIFNFAIGAQAALSAYVFYSLRITEGFPWPLAALVTLLGVGVLGSVVLERIGYWLSDAPPIMKVVATIGILVALESLLTGLYGSATIEFAPFLPSGRIRLGGVLVSESQMIVAALGLAVSVGLTIFFRRTRIGVAMEAIVDDADLLSIRGTNPTVVRRYAWAIGSVFVSISGMLIAPVLGIDVDTMVLLYVTAFGAAAVASFSSISRTFAASLAIGVIANIMAEKLGNQGNQVVAELYLQLPFLALVMALLFIPRRHLVERGASRVRRLPPVGSLGTKTTAAGVVGAVVLGLGLPRLIPGYDLDQYTTGLALSIVLASLGLLLWTSGQISLCQMAFAAVGATTVAHAENAGFPWLLAVGVAVLVVIPVGAIVSIPSFRLSGIYLAVSTFGFGLLFQNLLFTTFLMFGSADSINAVRPGVGGHQFSNEAYYYVTLIFAAAVAAFLIGLHRSRLGRMLRAVADSPPALEAHGVDTRLTRLFVFCISAAIAALGGALLIGVTQGASGESNGIFGYFTSVALIAVFAFSGRRLLLSPLIAAFIFEVVKIYRPFSFSWAIKFEGVAFGVIAIGVAVAPAIRRRRADSRSAERDGRSPVKERSVPLSRLSRGWQV